MVSIIEIIKNDLYLKYVSGGWRGIEVCILPSYTTWDVIIIYDLQFFWNAVIFFMPCKRSVHGSFVKYHPFDDRTVLFASLTYTIIKQFIFFANAIFLMLGAFLFYGKKLKPFEKLTIQLQQKSINKKNLYQLFVIKLM